MRAKEESDIRVHKKYHGPISFYNQNTADWDLDGKESKPVSLGKRN